MDEYRYNKLIIKYLDAIKKEVGKPIKVIAGEVGIGAKELYTIRNFGKKAKEWQLEVFMEKYPDIGIDIGQEPLQGDMTVVASLQKKIIELNGKVKQLEADKNAYEMGMKKIIEFLEAHYKGDLKEDMAQFEKDWATNKKKREEEVLKWIGK